VSNIRDIEPREHQVEILNQLNNLSPDEKNVTVQLLGGAGKTLLFFLFALIHQKGKKILFTAPKINLVWQTAQQYHAQVGVLQGSHAKNLDRDVIIGTIHTVISRGKSKKIDLNKFDFIFVDEAHEQKPRVKSLRELAPNATFIYLTATPVNAKGELLDFLSDRIIGDEFSPQYMIQKGYWCPTDYYTVGDLDTSNISINTTGEYNDKEITEAIKQSGVDIVKSSLPYINRKLPAVVVAQNIEMANALSKEFAKAGFRSLPIHSKTKASQLELIEGLKQGFLDMLVSVNMLKSGVDIPHLGTIILATKMASYPSYLQTYFRGCRSHPSKEKAVFIDVFNTIGNLGHPEDFKAKLPSPPAERKRKKCKKCKKGHMYLRDQDSNYRYYSCTNCDYTEKKEQSKEVLKCSCGWFGRNYKVKIEDKSVVAICPKCNKDIKQVDKLEAKEMILVQRENSETLSKMIEPALKKVDMRYVACMADDRQLAYLLKAKDIKDTKELEYIESRVIQWLNRQPNNLKELANLVEFSKTSYRYALELAEKITLNRVIRKLKNRKKQKPIVFLKSYAKYLEKVGQI